MIAALIGLVAFAAIALGLSRDSRSVIDTASAEMAAARLAAAADAGLVLGLAGVATDDQGERWRIDGSAHTLEFEGVRLVIAIEDERGKVPINVITEREARRLFEAAGASGTELASLVAAFLDWRDDDDERRAFGAEAPQYAPRGIRPRNADFRSIDELAELYGMTPAIFARIAPAVTLFFGESGGFSENNASPLALATMAVGQDGTPQEIQRRRERAGQRAAFDQGAGTELLRGRLLTVRVAASDGRGGTLRRATIVELTGNPREPYWVRARG